MSKNSTDRKTGFAPIAILFVVAVLLLAGGAVVYQKVLAPMISPTSSPSLTPTITTIPSSISQVSPIIPTTVTSKKLFDVNDEFAFGRKYPLEILSLQNDNLIAINCSARYQRQTNGNSYILENAKELLHDSTLLNFLQKVNTTLPNQRTVTVISKCSTSQGKGLVIYEVWAGGGGMENTIYLGYLSSALVINPLAIITNADKSPYLTGLKPLALTADGSFYYVVHAGDGGFGMRAIYKVNLQNGSVARIYQCKSSTDIGSVNPVTSINCE